MTLATLGYAALAGFIVLHLDDRGIEHGSTIFTAFALTVVTARVFFGWLPDRFGGMRCAIGAGLLEAVGLVVIALAQSLPVAALGAIAVGGAFSLIFPSLVLLVMDRVPSDRRGIAMGTFTACFDLGVGVGAPIAGVAAALGGYGSSFAVAALGAVAASSLALIVGRRLTPAVRSRVPPMSPPSSVTLHVLPPSHPSHAAAAALDYKGVEFERVEMTVGKHNEQMEAIYGAGNRTVPGMVVDGETVHGSRAIFAKLEEIAPDPPLFPDPIAERVREADRWGDEELQDLGRTLGWGALHFRPEALGTFAGGEALDPAGVDYAIKYVHATWRYHGITAALLAEQLAGVPEKLDHINELAAAGVIGGPSPTAADLQIGSTIRVLMTVGDLEPLLGDCAGTEIAMRWFPDYPGHVPAGAFPDGWVPSRR